MRRIALPMLILCIALPVFAGEIGWIKTYDKALAKAKATGQNVLVLITAPSWCHWCVKLEENVLSTEHVQAAVNKGFVALLVLDKVNDQDNPDLAKFSIEGYPTVRVIDKNGTVVAQDVYTQDPAGFLKNIAPHAKTAR